ncbi:hypothetical protein OIDMADRAFT_34195 [Oidiodendron maius Zn]|uniref:Uncharacterized protein n=1 Tax=Oidiodendron maius (strain Zn) TaxID=913774 RepID=A0A0C3GVY0_OIDMZ|nr:hypothetical protein OIDMADRAFT_34195 [Oidiodendron maius Zn]
MADLVLDGGLVCVACWNSILFDGGIGPYGILHDGIERPGWWNRPILNGGWLIWFWNEIGVLDVVIARLNLNRYAERQTLGHMKGPRTMESEILVGLAKGFVHNVVSL